MLYAWKKWSAQHKDLGNVHTMHALFRKQSASDFRFGLYGDEFDGYEFMSQLQGKWFKRVLENKNRRRVVDVSDQADALRRAGLFFQRDWTPHQKRKNSLDHFNSYRAAGKCHFVYQNEDMLKSPWKEVRSYQSLFREIAEIIRSVQAQRERYDTELKNP